MDVAAAARDLADRRDDLGVGRLLQHVAARARRRTPRARSAGRPASRARAPSRPRARAAASAPRRARCRPASRRPSARGRASTERASRIASRARARLADDLDVVLAVEQQPQARSGRPRGRRRSARGRVIATGHLDLDSVVPAFLRDSTLSVPPSSATRSRMPSMPKPPSRVARRVEAAAVVLDQRRHRAVACARARCSRCRASACLTTFVSASWTMR